MRNKQTYMNLVQALSAAFLVMLLTWLTISLPFVNDARQQVEKEQIGNIDQSNPVSQPDEKAPSNSILQSVTEEYIHHTDFCLEPLAQNISRAYIHAHESTYIAFHGELLTPPPNYNLL